jgi:hypothetical protein
LPKLETNGMEKVIGKDGYKDMRIGYPFDGRSA